ncbi:hypothetical protein HWV62_10935 [Athelia sp. TMB]|nr:hypothetical protein HWV62_10935 [Athelia sp. TMB]
MVTTRRQSGKFTSETISPTYVDPPSDEGDSEEYESPDTATDVEESDGDEYKGRGEIGGWSHGHSSNSKFFWNQDVIDMCEQLGSYQKNVSLRKRGAKKALDDFVAARIQLVEQTAKDAEKYKLWTRESTESVRREKQARSDKRQNDIKERLVTLGHDPRDIRLWNLPGVNRDTELTERGWNMIRKEIEAEVNSEREIRIAKERAPITEGRKAVVRKVYKEFKATLVPISWANYPTPEVVFHLECFSSLINDPSDEPLDIEHCRRALEQLPQQVDTLNAEKTAVLLSLITKHEQEIAMEGVEDAHLQGGFRPSLDLATSIFSCHTCSLSCTPILTGPDALHHCCSIRQYGRSAKCPRIPGYKFATDIARAIVKLASLLQLDPRSTKSTDLDQLDARFVCTACPQRRESGYEGKKAMSWRNCLTHAQSYYGTQHHSWELLAPKDCDEVKIRERVLPDPAEAESQWSCNLCPKYLEATTPLMFVIQHLKEDHEKHQPTEGIDFFHDQQHPRKQRISVMSGTLVAPSAPKGPPPKDHKCKHCAGTRKFDILGANCHIKAK